MDRPTSPLTPRKIVSFRKANAFAKRLRKLRGLHSKPTTRFPFGLVGPMWYHTPVVIPDKFHNVKWRYGVELEFEFFDLVRPTLNYAPWFDFRTLSAELANHLLTLTTKEYEAGITSDSSLVNGWELVLGAASIKTIMKWLTPILTDRHLRPFFRPCDGAALHVTVDRFEEVEAEYAFHDFWDNDNTTNLFSDVIQREPNGYCKRRGIKTRKFVKYRMKPDGHNHYWRCSVRSSGALEVRVFKADYTVNGVYRQLQMVHAVNMAVRRGVYDYDKLCNIARERIKRLTTNV